MFLVSRDIAMMQVPLQPVDMKPAAKKAGAHAESISLIDSGPTSGGEIPKELNRAFTSLTLAHV
ncbi:hypothetical protein A3709_02365 [Halioglobus sp. HI00S01]|nr:hypothetical protein A3709_02365 [Halioglobus sp. HI00S01]